MQLPVIRCPCGNGPCSIFTSNTPYNPLRDYYACRQKRSSRECGYFRWVDEVVEFKVPQCPCGAGASSLNRGEKGKWFLACRIKKGHGACGFFQRADPHINSRMNIHFHGEFLCERPECFEDEVLSTSHSMENEIPNRHSSSAIQETESSSHQVLGTLAEEAEVPNRMLETKSLDDPNLKKFCFVSYMVSQSENDRKSVSHMQICAEGDILNQDDIRKYIGWLDRLGIPQCRKDEPVLPFKDDLILSNDATLCSAIGPNGVESSEVITQQPSTPSKDAQLPRGVSRYRPRCQNRNTRQNDSTSLLVFKNIGEGFLKTLEDKNLVDREEMCKIAESFFEAFSYLSISWSSFSKHVMKYIDYKSKLAEVESSMREDLLSQQFEGIFRCEEAECEVSDNHFQSLHGESSRSKKRKLFRNLEQEWEQYEPKTSEQETSLFETSPETSVRQRSMEATQEEMEEDFAMASERKFLKDEATTALKMARAELPY